MVVGLPASLRRGSGNYSFSGLIINPPELEGLGLLDDWRHWAGGSADNITSAMLLSNSD